MGAKIRCKKCGDILESKYRHDFKMCSCKSCYIDGGNDYCRVGGNKEDYEMYSMDFEEFLWAKIYNVKSQFEAFIFFEKL